MPSTFKLMLTNTRSTTILECQYKQSDKSTKMKMMDRSIVITSSTNHGNNNKF